MSHHHHEHEVTRLKEELETLRKENQELSHKALHYSTSYEGARLEVRWLRWKLEAIRQTIDGRLDLDKEGRRVNVLPEVVVPL
jgi:hypothetical protein